MLSRTRFPRQLASPGGEPDERDRASCKTGSRNPLLRVAGVLRMLHAPSSAFGSRLSSMPVSSLELHGLQVSYILGPLHACRLHLGMMRKFVNVLTAAALVS